MTIIRSPLAPCPVKRASVTWPFIITKDGPKTLV